MMKMKVECDNGEKVTSKVRVLVAPGITTVLWSVDVALDEYGIATVYDHQPCPRVQFPSGSYQKLHKKDGCRWMTAKITMGTLKAGKVNAMAGKSVSFTTPEVTTPKGSEATTSEFSPSSKPTVTQQNKSKSKTSKEPKGKFTEVKVTKEKKVTRREELVAIREESEKRKGGAPTDKSRLLWHRRLRHTCDRRLDMTCLAVDFMRISPKDQGCSCIVCKLANMKQLKYLIGSAITSDPMDIVNIDWIGPISPPAYLTGERYILTFTIKNTKFRACGFAVTRDQAPALIQDFVLQFGMMKKLRMDNAKEFTSKEVKAFADHIQEFCQDNALDFTLKDGQGIQLQYTCNYAHGQGGPHERTNGLFLEGARVTMMEANEETDQWLRAVNMDTTIINMIANKTLDWITPYEAQYQTRPDANMLKVPFSMCYVWIPHEVRKRHKMKHLGDRAELGMLIGYPHDHKGWEVSLIGKKGIPKTVVSRDVHFNEEVNGRAAIKLVDPKNVKQKIEKYNARYKLKAVTDEKAQLEIISEVKEVLKKEVKVPALLKQLQDTEEYKSAKSKVTAMVTRVVKQHNALPLSELSLTLAMCSNIIVVDLIEGEDSCGSDLLSQSAFPMADNSHASILSSINTTVKVERGLDEFNIHDTEVIRAFRASLIDGVKIPKSMKQALKGPNSELWKAAMQIEIDNFIRLKVWKMTEWKPGMRVFNTMWVCAIGLNLDLTPKHKARLCLLGNKMQHGIDYDETHSPTVRDISIHILVTVYVVGLRNKHNMSADLMDNTAAYLNADVIKSFYFNDPVKGEVWINGVRWVCMAMKAIYGGPDSGRAWDIERDGITLSWRHKGMEDVHFVRCISDPCVHVCVKDDNISLMHKDQVFMMSGVHVDDSLTVSNDGGQMFKSFMEHFEAQGIKTKSAKPKKFVGYSWHEDDDCVILHMHDYIIEALDELGLSGLEPREMPHNGEFRIWKGEEEEIPCNTEQHGWFRKACGIAIWITKVLPVVCYQVASLCSKLAKPMVSDLARMTLLFAYIKSRADHGILFSKDPNLTKELTLECWYDASHAAEQPSRKSVGGCKLKLGDCNLSCSTKIIKMTSLSPQESEYRSGVVSTTSIMSAKHLLKEMGIPQGAVMQWGDNRGVMSLCKNFITSMLSRHIEVWAHHMRQMAMLKETDPRWCSGATEIQQADGLTKPLEPKEKHLIYEKQMICKIPK